MLIFYDNDFSTCAQKVRMLLCEKGAEWTTQWLDLRRGDQFDSSYLKINPNGVVPAIIHDDKIVIESTLILTILIVVLLQDWFLGLCKGWLFPYSTLDTEKK